MKLNKPQFAGESRRVKLNEICTKGKSSLRQKDVFNDGPYNVYGASGIVGTMSDYQNEIPYVAVVKDGAGVGRASACEPMTSVLGTMQALIPNSNVERDYLLHLVRSLRLGEGFSGSTIPHIYFKDYGRLEVPLPPLEAQKQIVSQLGLVEAQIEQAEAQIEQLDHLVKSRFVEMFGDTYLNSMNWTSCRLGDLISFMTSGSRGWARYYSDDGGYFLTIKNVRNCKIDISDVQHVVAPEGKESVRTKVKENDVLISITADLGRTGVVTKEIADHGAYINQHLACIRLIDDSVHSVFLSHFLESPGGINQFAKKNQNGVKAGLNFNLIRSLEIQMPPFALQQEFAAFVTQVDKSRFIAQQQIEKLQMLYDSLAQEYFGD